MVRTTVVGSWPPETQFKQGLQSYFAGDLSTSDIETLLKDAASSAIAQQKRCGLDEYTGGETSADMFILHFPKYLSGIERTNNAEAWDGRGEYRLVGEIDAPNGLGIASAFRREKALDPALSKVTIPGPSEILMMIDTADKHVEVWTRVIELIRQEIAECIAAGAQDVQLDLPHVAMGLVDNWWEGDPVATIREIFKEAEGVRRSVHFCYGDFQAKSWTENRNFHALLPTIKALDGIVDRIVVEFSLPEQWAERELLAEIPDSMEVAVGIIDVKSQSVEQVIDIDSKIRELLNYLPGDRLLICPSCGLGRRNVELATGKVKAMVQAVEDVNRSLVG
jgi:5-methyltetrahydropteroyltriglutamate--homocysteine methyltransferase